MSIPHATDALNSAATQFQAYLDALEDVEALEAMGFKRIVKTRHFNDSNVTITYPGGGGADYTSSPPHSFDGTTTHAYTYNSAFPDDPSDIIIMWTCNARIGNTVSDVPRGHLALTKSDGTLLSNAEMIAIEINGGITTSGAYMHGTIASNAEISRQPGQNSFDLEQRACMDYCTNDSGTMLIDRIELTILEFAK